MEVFSVMYDADSFVLFQSPNNERVGRGFTRESGIGEMSGRETKWLFRRLDCLFYQKCFMDDWTFEPGKTLLDRTNGQRVQYLSLSCYPVHTIHKGKTLDIIAYVFIACGAVLSHTTKVMGSIPGTLAFLCGVCLYIYIQANPLKSHHCHRLEFPTRENWNLL